MTERFPIVKVEWLDAGTRKDATFIMQNIEDTGLFKAVTVGYLVHENKERIAVCGFIFPRIEDGFDFESGFRDVHFIPRGMIKKIIYIRKADVL